MSIHEEDGPSDLEYPVSSPGNKMIPDSELIGAAEIGDRHGPDLVISTGRITQINEGDTEFDDLMTLNLTICLFYEGRNRHRY